MYFVLAAYASFFSFLTWKNFSLGLGILIASLPAYLIRPSFGPLPTTVLEINFAIVFFVWLFKYAKNDWKKIRETFLANKVFFVFLAVFFVSSLLGVWVSDMIWKSFGQWRAYFLEPLILFFIILGREKKIGAIKIISFLAVGALLVGALGVWQKIFGWPYPPELWDDNLGGRVVSFFTSPNSIGLFVAPLTALSLSALLKNGFKKNTQTIILICSILFSLLAVFFSKSTGSALALLAGFFVFIFFLGYKKISILSFLIILILAVSLPQTKDAILFRDQSGQNRLTLWAHSLNYLSSSPKNFILGAGIRQYFRKVEKPLYNPRELERLIYPHNIILNFWTEIGLFGTLSFLGIFIFLLYKSYKIFSAKDRLLGAGLFVALIIFFVHGLVDVPYFKNDLAIIFWTISSLVFLI